MKRLLTVICLGLCIFAISGCSKVDEIKDTIDPGSKLSLDFGWTVLEENPNESPVGIVVTNNSDKVATNVTFQVTPYDADGNEIEYSEGDPGYESGRDVKMAHTGWIGRIMPGEKAGTYDAGFSDLKNVPDHIEVTIREAKWVDPSEFAEGTVTVEDYSYAPGDEVAYVTLKNTTEYDFDINASDGSPWMNLNFIGYGADGKIVGADFGTVQYLAAGAEEKMEILLDGGLAGAGAETVEIYPDVFIPEPEEE